MDTITLAYLAGAIDSDGSISIKKSTYHKRVRKDATNPVYSERVMLKQVTPDIPQLLQKTFGGSCVITKCYSDNSKDLWSFNCTDKIAAHLCNQLLPYLRIKRRQAELALELRETKDSKYEQLAYWFNLEYPNWQQMELITTTEATTILGYTNSASVHQAIRNGTLLAINKRKFRQQANRIPRLLVEQLAANGPRVRPPQLIEWRERLYQEVHELNKIGINGTPIYHQTGYFKPKE
jgi:hypothetical protein